MRSETSDVGHQHLANQKKDAHLLACPSKMLNLMYMHLGTASAACV